MPDKLQAHCVKCGKTIRLRKNGSPYAHKCNTQGTAYDPQDCPVCNPRKGTR